MIVREFKNEAKFLAKGYETMFAHVFTGLTSLRIKINDNLPDYSEDQDSDDGGDTYEDFNGSEIQRSQTYGDSLGVNEKVHLVGLKKNIKTSLYISFKYK